MSHKILASNNLVLTHEYGVNPDTREIWLHSDGRSEDEYGIDFRSATSFEKNLRILDRTNKPIIIHMHTIGGDWNDGISIYDTIKSAQSFVTIIAYGHARSMSSIILQAGDLRLTMPHTDVMLHMGAVKIDDTELGAETAIEWNRRTLNDYMLEIYVNSCQNGKYFQGWKRSKIKQYLRRKMKDKQDWYMKPDEAVNYGLADGIISQSHKWSDIYS